MAEIKDVYSLEFNSSQFQTEINSAIASIDQLNSAMEQGVDVADELEEAQANLVSVLNTEAKGVEQINQKRNALVNTQKQVNAESKTGVAVGKQLDTTNKQIAVSTGQAATQQRSFAGSLVQGARNLNSMRRAGMMIGNLFRVIAGINPFGLLLTAIPAVISYLTSATAAQTSFNEAAESAIDTYVKEKVALDDLFVSLSDVNLKGEDRKAVIDEINNQYGQYLPNLLTEASTAEDVAAAYDLVNQALIKKAITQAKTQALEEATAKLLKGEMDAMKKIAENQAIIDEQKAKGYGKVSQGARDNLKLQQKNIKLLKDEYQQSLKIIDQASKDLEATLIKVSNTTTTTTNNNTKKTRTYTHTSQKKTVKQTQSFYKQLQKLAVDQLNNARKIISDEEKARIKGIQDNIKATEDLLNYQISLTNEGSEERITAENQYTDVLTDLYRRYAQELGMSETQINQFIADRLKNRTELYDEFYTNQSDLNANSIETQLNQDLLALEQERNKKLDAAFLNVDLQEKIDEEYNQKRLVLEAKANQKILDSRIKFLQKSRDLLFAAGDTKAVSELDKQISDLKLKYEELNKATIDANKQILKGATDAFVKTTEEGEKTTKTLTDKQKELIDQTTQLIQGVSDNVFNVLNAQVQAYIEGLDKAIDKSKSALDEIRSNSENYNARQLEIEKERLEKLEAERARAVEREKNLASVQLAINAAIAISKAAAETGPGAPVAIALVIASLIAGFAQARVAAGNAFFHGVEYLERGQNKAGRDTIPAMLNEGERVITTDTNNKYWDVLSAVHNNRIPADVLNTFSKAYQQGGIKNALGAFGDNVSLSSELGQKSIFVNVAQTYGGLENRLERIENVLTELPKYMPRTTVSANANGIFRIVEQRQARKNFSKNWSK
jgi:hypothetical protein